IRRIGQHTDQGNSWNQLLGDLDLLTRQTFDLAQNARQIATRSSIVAIKPKRTGSFSIAATIGIDVVAFFAASAAGGSRATIRSGRNRTSSSARAGRRVLSASA